MSTETTRQFDAASAAKTSIRQIPLQKMLDSAIDWTAETLKREEAPGVIVGISGTDSLLSYIVCLEAFKKLGKPLENVRGVNFQHKTQDKFFEMNVPFKCVASDDTTWVERELFPWISARYPEARLEVDTSIPHSKDGARWGALHDKAKEEVNGRGDMLMGTYYFPVGTRNATEDSIYGYTLITGAVSLFPIRNIYKSEVIDLSRYLGVPEIAIEKSREIDCDCGRFEVQAYKMDQLDTYIMARKGLIDPKLVEALDPQDLIDVKAFEREERIEGEFKGRTPYVPKDLAAEPLDVGAAPAPDGSAPV